MLSVLFLFIRKPLSASPPTKKKKKKILVSLYHHRRPMPTLRTSLVTNQTQSSPGVAGGMSESFTISKMPFPRL